MKKLIYLLCFLIISISYGQNKDQEGYILLEEATVISPETNEIYTSYILIKNDRIEKVSKTKPQLNTKIKSINLKGKFIIPGLIDNHVHVSGVNGLTEKDVINNPNIVKEFKDQLPKSYLYFGYTTLIDLSTPSMKEIKEFNKAKIKPTLLHVGSGAVIGKGYGITNWNDSIPNYIDVENQTKNHTVKEVVSRIKNSGAIGLKTYYEPGFNPNAKKFPVPTSQLIKEIIKESHSNDLLVLVHANSIESHGFISNYSIDVTAHGLWRWGNLSLTNQGELPNKIAEILDSEIKNNIAYTPTLQVINGLKAMSQTNFLEDPELENVLPHSILSWYKNNQNKLYSEVFGDAPKPVILRNFNKIDLQGQASLKYMNDHNGTIVFGTDTPSSLTYGNPPGYNGYLEMKKMFEARIPLNKILQSATINNANIFRLDHDYGTIETGKIANLLILNKNPLQTIEAYNSIVSVIINGVLIKRKELQAN